VKSSNTIWNSLGTALFIVGFLIGVIFISLGLWSDLEGGAFWGTSEAAAFDSSIPMDARLKGLTCPVLITSQETATISTRVENRLDRPVKVMLQTDLSNPDPFIEAITDSQTIQLNPQEQRQFSWMASIQNLKFNRLILARTYLINEQLRIPARTSHCGILVVNHSWLNSQQIIVISISASLFGMILGMFLWQTGKRPLKDRTRRSAYTMLALAILTLAGILATLTGSWFMVIVFLLLILLLLLALLENTIMRLGSG
jgi:hypothetical protein